MLKRFSTEASSMTSFMSKCKHSTLELQSPKSRLKCTIYLIEFNFIDMKDTYISVCLSIWVNPMRLHGLVHYKVLCDRIGPSTYG